MQLLSSAWCNVGIWLIEWVGTLLEVVFVRRSIVYFQCVFCMLNGTVGKKLILNCLDVQTVGVW